MMKENETLSTAAAAERGAAESPGRRGRQGRAADGDIFVAPLLSRNCAISRTELLAVGTEDTVALALHRAAVAKEPRRDSSMVDLFEAKRAKRERENDKEK